jgi:hydrophobe/amphiphile efflux-1 (HAE1) family protein
MREEGLSPKEATRKSMDQISGALVGIGLVLCAAFVPMAFFTGSSGVIYRQFSLTIVSSVALSVMIALILTPALCATILRPIPKGHHAKQRGFFGWFNRVFDRNADRYARGVASFLRHSGRALIFYAAIAVAVVLLFLHSPTGFMPDEDTGVLFAMAQLPPGSTREQADKVLQKMENHFLTKEKDLMEGMFGVLGFSFSGTGQNQVLVFVKLKDWEERQRPDQRVTAIQGRAMAEFMQFKDAFAFAFVPPAALELGNATGFDVRVIDRAGLGHEALMDARNQLLGAAAHNPAVTKVRPNGLDDMPEYHLRVDQEKAAALGLSLGGINDELNTIWGSIFANDFIDKGRVKKVYIQADAPFRMLPEDVNRWYVRNMLGGMVPFSAFASAEWSMGSPKLERFNGSPSASILGEPAPGHSSGEAMEAIEKMSKALPPGIGIEWAGLSYEERLAGSKSAPLYTIAVLMVFLCLAALYESWAIPFSVLMDMPLGALGVVAATSIRGMPNDIYFQIGLITIIGLSAKNAILVVEFAKERFDAGATLVEAALYAVRQRLRPILMTSIAFGLGVLPLALNKGAGSGSQNAIGTGIVGGAVTTTLLGLFFVPLYFVTVLRLFKVKPLHAPPRSASKQTEEPKTEDAPPEEELVNV